MPVTKTVNRGVAGEGEEPRREFAARVVLAPMTVGADEHFLRHVLRLRGIAKHSMDEIQHRLPVTGQQFGKRRIVLFAGLICHNTGCILAHMKGILKLALLALAITARAEELTTQAFLSHDALAPGAAFRVAIALDIVKPWHVNANQVNDKSLIPTTVKWETPASVVIEKTIYPAGKPVKLAWSDKPVLLYEGRVVIFAEGRVAKDARLGPVKIAGTLRYQACDDETCVAPKTIPVIV